MSKPNAIQITIPHPYSQNSDEMALTADGRFCAHCQKTVIDFSTWGDTALYNFFSKNTGNVCGTFSYDQLNRPVHIPYQPHSRLYRITIAMGLTLIFAQTPHLLAQSRPPIVQSKGDIVPEFINDKHYGGIYGRVLDDKKEVFPGAIVQVYLGAILKEEVITDLDGNYTIGPLEAGYYDLLVKHNGYNEIKVTSVIVSTQNRTTQNFILKRVAANELPTVSVVTYRKPLVDGSISANWLIITTEQKPPLIDMDNPSKKTFTKEELEHMGQ